MSGVRKDKQGAIPAHDLGLPDAATVTVACLLKIETSEKVKHTQYIAWQTRGPKVAGRISVPHRIRSWVSLVQTGTSFKPVIWQGGHHVDVTSASQGGNAVPAMFLSPGSSASGLSATLSSAPIL